MTRKIKMEKFECITKMKGDDLRFIWDMIALQEFNSTERRSLHPSFIPDAVYKSQIRA